MSDPSKLSARYTTMVVATLSLIGLTCVAFLVPVPYVTMRPGPAFDTLGRLPRQADVHVRQGHQDLPDIGLAGLHDRLGHECRRPPQRWARCSSPIFDEDIAVVPKSLIYPDDQSEEQSTEESAAQLSGSKDSSRVAALRAAGYTVTGMPTIAGVVKGGAADGKLKAGDVITAIDGTKVDDARRSSSRPSASTSRARRTS